MLRTSSIFLDAISFAFFAPIASRSYKNTIPIFCDDYSKYCSKIKTDKQDYKTQPLTVDGDITFHLFEHLFRTPEEKVSLTESYLNDRNFGYGHAKKLLAERLEETFAPARAKFRELMARPKDIQDQQRKGTAATRSQ